MQEESLILQGSDQTIRKQSVSLDEPLCRDLMLPQVPLSEIGTGPASCMSDKGDFPLSGRLKKASSYVPLLELRTLSTERSVLELWTLSTENTVSYQLVGKLGLGMMCCK